MPRRWIAAAAGAFLVTAGLATPAAAAPPVVDDVQPQIVGGTPAAQGEFPWVVRLGGCGGSLIRPNIVLTAAHCVGPTGEDTSYTATLNAVDLQSPTALTSRSNFVYRAPGFTGVIGSPDWALVRLQSSFSVPTLQIAVKTAHDSGTFTIAGWGATFDGGGWQRFLRKAQVSSHSDLSCRAAYGSPFVSSEMICAGPMAGGVGTCDGDSGGPLFRRDLSNRWLQVGITSWGSGCALPNRPAVFTQVSTFAREIQNWANALAADPCGEAACSTLNGAYISHYTGLNCFGTESFYTPYSSNGTRWSWDGGGVPGMIVRTVTNRSWRDADGVCRNSWPNGNTLSGFVTIYRHACAETSCTNLGGAYISHYTAPDCAGTEAYYTPYFGDGGRRSWDGGGIAGTTQRTLTTFSWRGTDMTCHNDWPGGNPLSGFVTIYR